MFHHVKELQFNARVSGPDPRFASLLLEHCGQHVHGLDELVIAANGERLCIGERLLELGRKLIHAHN